MKKIIQQKTTNHKRKLFFQHLWPKIAGFFRQYYKVILIWLGIIAGIIIAGHFHVDRGIIFIIVVVFGAFSQAFTGLVSLIALVPFLGPLLVKVLTLPIFWILNALGYFISAVAIKRGHKKEIINYRFVTLVFLTGFAVGFIIAKLI